MYTESIINELTRIYNLEKKPSCWAKIIAKKCGKSIRTVNAVLQQDRHNPDIAIAIISFFKKYENELNSKLQEATK